MPGLNFKTITLFLVAAPLIFIPALTQAQVRQLPDNTITTCTGAGCTFAAGGPIWTYIYDIIFTISTFIGVVALGFLLYAAFRYITSRGDTEGATAAKRQIAYAMLGIFVAVSAASIIAVIDQPTADVIAGQGDLTAGPLSNRITIVIISIATLIGAVSTGFLLYAAFKYITSQGDQEAASTAKRQIVYAMLGIAVWGASALLLGLADPDESPVAAVGLKTTVQLYINSALILIGVVAVVFLIYAAFKYITSQGDSEAASTAKSQIIYALIGIIIAGVAWILVDLAAPASSGEAAVVLGNVILGYINIALTFVAVIAAAFLVIAGFRYISSQGDTEAASTAKSQIVYAIIGILVAGLAALIVNVVAGIAGVPLIPNTDAVGPGDLANAIRTIVNRFLTISAVVTAIYIVLSGFMYITSGGDEERASKAKMQLLYAVIGLLVIIISGVLVNFIIASIPAPS